MDYLDNPAKTDGRRNDSGSRQAGRSPTIMIDETSIPMITKRMMRATFLAAILNAAASQVCAQSSQNPSPMVERTREHLRIEPANHPGIERSIDAGLTNPVTLFVGEGVTPGEASLLIHFMGPDHVAMDGVANSHSHDVLAVVNLGSGSSAFEQPFRENDAFESLIEAAADGAAQALAGPVSFGLIDVSAFSAGYGAVRAILSRHADRVRGVLLLDALHTGYVPERTPLAEGGRIDSTLLTPFVRFAEQAVAGEKAFVVTHSEVFPGTFASTTETSDYLVDQMGLRRRATLKWGPVGMQQLSAVEAGGFVVLGFAGNSAPDHVDHLHGMKAFLPLLHASDEPSDSPADDLPPHITRLTNFGERADWSHDGRKLLFVEKTFGDVYEIELETRAISLLTGHFYHEGFLRAMYLSNGDILLFGPRDYDPSDPYKSRWRDSELWVLDKHLDKPPVPLGTEVFEGAAVSRTRLRIVWMIGHADYYDTDDLLEPRNLPYGVAQFWMADIDYSNGEPRLANKKLVLDSRDLSFEADIEPQNFRRPDERMVIFSAYRVNAIEEMGTNAEVLGLDLQTGEVTNYTNSPAYEEPEGVYPDGEHTLVESDRHGGGGDKHIDLYKLRLDGSGAMERLTYFSDTRGYKASNPVVSDDGRYIAFQMARSTDMPGVGRGLFLYDNARVPE